MALLETPQAVQVAATVIGIAGGLLGLLKYFSDKREKELREWQKVVLYKIFRQNEMDPLSFTSVLEKYRSEAQAFPDIDLKKKEISEDALRRVLLELASSGILSLEPANSFRLKVSVPKIDDTDLRNRINKELVSLIGASPFVYTLDDVARQIAPKVGLEFQILRSTLLVSIDAGVLEMNDDEKMAFPTGGRPKS